MAVCNHKLGERLHQTKSAIPSDEVPWQQLMLFNYLMFETIDAMAQERATSNHTPLNHHWQQFIHHLRLNRPKLSDCLDKLMADLEGAQ